jgi:hypothetical protein
MTNEEVMQIMTNMGLHEGGMDNWVANNAWWKFANVVAQHEREACAEVCKKQADVYGAFEQTPELQSAWAACIDNRDAIRARGENV